MMGKSASDVAVGVAASDSKYYAEARSWEHSRVLMIERSERRAWIVAIGSAVIAVLAVVALAFLAPLKSAVPFLIYVNRLTGDTEVRQAKNVPMEFQEIIDKHWLLQYVTARERYYSDLLKSDYDLTMALSGPVPRREYGHEFDGVDAVNKRLGRAQEYAVRIISVSVMPRKHNEPGQATVRFEKTLRTLDSDQAGDTQRYVATIAYEYHQQLLAPERTLILNPLGFEVTAYRVAPELTEMVPTSPVLPPAGRPATAGAAARQGTTETQGGGAR